MVQHQRDALIRYVANPDYWRGKAPLDNLVFTIIPDATVRYQKLRDRECHVIAAPDQADIPAMALNSDVRLVRQVATDVGYLAFNTRRPPLNDPRVRRALAMAVDRGAILDKIYQGMGHPAATMVPPGLSSREKHRRRRRTPKAPSVCWPKPGSPDWNLKFGPARSPGPTCPTRGALRK